ncbi:MAG: hypothetical protein GX616_04160, partial [Planctomycetes bacterium]|nr:hypothetical protein [Planctomycetota bacterium]
VPRQLVVIGSGASGTGTTNITFTNNDITGIAGAFVDANTPSGNTLVTIDADDSVIQGNVFEGITTRYGTSLRVRRPGVTISGNIFRSTGLTSTTGHLHLEQNALDATLVGANTFDKGVYVESATGGKVGLSIQGFVDAVPAGTTINVLPGTYAERLLIDKGVTLLGAMAGVDPTQAGARIDLDAESIITETGLVNANPNVLIDIADGVSGLMIDGFTLVGDPTDSKADTSVIRCGGDAGTANQVTVANNVIDGRVGVLLKNGAELDVSTNRFVVNKNGVVIQFSASNAFISTNVFTPGDEPASDRVAIFLTGSTDTTIAGNTASDFGFRAVQGSNNTRLVISKNTFTGNEDAISLWGATTFVDITRNVLSGHSGTGIVVKGQDVLIAGNCIEKNTVGVEVAKHTLETQRVRISNNRIAGNGSGLVVASEVSETVDAQYNWWGSTSGPVTDGPNKVSGNVDTSNWLSPEPDSCPMPVTLPEAPTLSVVALDDTTDELGQVDAKVMLNPGDFEVFAFEFTLAYDAGVLALDNVGPGNAFSSMSKLDATHDSGYSWTVHETPGMIEVWVTLSGDLNGFTTPSELVALSFTAASTGDCSAKSNLTLSKVILLQKAEDAARIHPVTVVNDSVTAYKLVPVSGDVELQGRTDWSGVAVSLTGDPFSYYGITTDDNGRWSQQVACGEYDIKVTIGGYLDAEATKVAPFTADAGKLLGGNADMRAASYNKIFLQDVVAIANVIGGPAPAPEPDLYPDINADGTINILDLVLAGITYTEEGPKSF